MTFKLGRPLTILQLLFLLIALFVPVASAAVNDGKIMFGSSGGGATPEAYSNADGGSWSADTQGNAAETTIAHVHCEANPQSPEVLCGVLTSTNTRLSVYRWDGSSWTLDWFDNAPASSAFQVFDLAYEQDSGDALVVYSNGGTTNELSYRKRVDDVWDGSSTTLESNRTTGVVEWVEMEARPSSDEIAVAFADANDDLNAFVWDGSAWGSEPTSTLSTSLVTTNNRKFDLAYEQSSGDLLIAYSITGTAGCGLALKTAGSTNWTDDDDEGVLADTASVIDLGAEPGTNRIAFSSISAPSGGNSDLQLAIWDGTDQDCSAGAGGCAFTSTYTNADTATQSLTANWLMVGNGWANGRALYAYTNAAETTLSYFTFQTSDSLFCCNDGCGTTLCGANDTPLTVTPPFTSGTKNHLVCEQFSGSPAKVMVTTVDSNSDLWTLTYDGTSNTANWATVDDGTAGNNALETATSTATQMPAGSTITSHDPTPVGLISFKATGVDGGALLEWKTASEAYIHGFKLYRIPSLLVGAAVLPLEEVTQKPIRARGNPLSGGKYPYLDNTLKAGETYAYYLKAIQKDGDSESYGPIVLDQPSTFIGKGEEGGYLRRDGKKVVKGVVEPRKKSYHLSKERRKGRRCFAPLKMELNENGIYRVTGAELVEAGLDLSLVDPLRLKLFNQGKEVPITLSGTEDGIFHPEDFLEFYGKKMTGRYTTTNVYWLKQFGKAGQRIGEVASGRGGTEVPSYLETYHLERNEAYYGDILHNDMPPEDPFFFVDELLSPASVTVPFSVDQLFLGAPQEARLRVSLQGLQPGLTQNFSQHAVVSINGEMVGDFSWFGDDPFIGEATFPISLLTEGTNTFTVEAPDDVRNEGGNPQIILMDWVEVTYPRNLVAREGELTFKVERGWPHKQQYRIEGLRSPEVEIVGIAEGGRTFRVTQFDVGSNQEVFFSGTFAPGTTFVVSEVDALKGPSALFPDEPSRLTSPHNEADYLILSHADFEEAVRDLADYRAAQGLTVKVVDMEDVYDEFNNGVFSPIAIKDFLGYTYDHWKGKPTYVLLVGDGTFDYQDFFGTGVPNFVPAYFVASPDFGEAPSDPAYGDLNGDGVSEIAVGRLAVQDPSQVISVIGKIKSYEGTPPTGKAHLAADDFDTFRQMSDYLKDVVLPEEIETTTLYLGDIPAEEVRQGLLDGINLGTDTVNYIGHGAVIFWSSHDILNTSDIDSLSNSTYPLLTSFSCLSSYFVYPGSDLDSLSEVFLNVDNKGVVASLGPTALSSPVEQQIFMNAFYEALADENILTLGEAHLKAQEELKEKASPTRAKTVNQTFLLLGDPALKLFH